MPTSNNCLPGDFVARSCSTYKWTAFPQLRGLSRYAMGKFVESFISITVTTRLFSDSLIEPLPRSKKDVFFSCAIFKRKSVCVRRDQE